MAVLPGFGLLNPPSDPAYGDPNVAMGGSANSFGGLLGQTMNNPLFNFGVGLLSTVGQSTDPEKVSGIGNIGKAFGYASQAQEKALQNELRRQAILQQQQELQGTARIQQLFKDDPTILNDPPRMLAALAAAAPKELASGLASVYADPLRPIKEQLATDQATAAAATTADLKQKNNAQWLNSYAAGSAAEYLKSTKGGELLAKSPALARIIAGSGSLVAAAGGDPNWLIAQFPFLKGTDQAELTKMMEAVDTLASRSSLLTPQTGDLSTSTLGTQLDAYRQVQQSAEDVAKADKRLALPEPPKFAWSSTPATAATAAATAPPAAPPPPGGSLSYSPQAGVVQSPANQTVSRPLPPDYYQNNQPAAAAPPAAPSLGDRLGSTIGNAYNRGWNTLFGSPAPAAPAAPLAPPVPTPASTAASQPQSRKVATVRYDPQGRPMFRSEAEVHRAINNKWLALPPPGQTVMIIIDGRLYPLTNHDTGEPSGG